MGLFCYRGCFHTCKIILQSSLLADIFAGFLGIFHNYDMVWGNGDQAHTIGAYFAAEIARGEPRVDEESLELRFFAPDALPELFAEDHRAAVDAWRRGVRLPLPRENAPSARP